jgi:hypothetical protein
VWNAHLLYSYRDCNDEGSILHMLIPKGKCSNGQCLMFVDKGNISGLGLEKIRHETIEAHRKAGGKNA